MANPAAAVDKIVSEIGGGEEMVVPILQAVQREFNYLPADALWRIAEITKITPRNLESITTFYSQFRLTPTGRHRIKVCVGTACFVKGADQIFDGFREVLGITGADDTDSDGVFTVEKVACLGCCMLAPAVQIGDQVFGYLTRRSVPNTIADFLDSVGATGGHANRPTSPARTTATTGEISLCTCTSCRASGSGELYSRFEERLSRSESGIGLKRVGCGGASYNAPQVEVRAGEGMPEIYTRVAANDVDAILWKHFRTGAVRRLMDGLLVDKNEERVLPAGPGVSDGKFLKAQVRIVTEGADQTDPLDLEEYIRGGGFAGLAKAREMQSEDTLKELKESRLRGRGGAGFPAWKKWSTVRNAPGTERIVVCNADEGDPGAFMDRMILESFPYRVIEGVAIAALTVGADRAIIYIRSEYPQAVKTITEAAGRCKEPHLGSLNVSVVEGAGAFVCGEETALVAALEGRRGSPRWRPPYPAEQGVGGAPTLIHNVETLATIPWIMAHGAAEFLGIGTESSPGTKTFALAGKIVRGGLVEIPMGFSIREIVEGIGGGVAGEKTLKAVQIGGPSGGCIPVEQSELTVDYDSLAGSGTMMGSGGMIVLDESDCMVDIARYFMVFTQAESCGKCTCCRIGTKRMLEILNRLCAGTGSLSNLDTLKSLAETVRDGSLCGLGKTAPNPVLSTLKHFEEEYLAHVDGRCPSGRCRDLIRYFVTDRCIGCTRCAQNCPVDAIAPAPYQRHTIDAEVCIRCGTCAQVCPSDAVEVR